MICANHINSFHNLLNLVHQLVTLKYEKPNEKINDF